MAGHSDLGSHQTCQVKLSIHNTFLELRSSREEALAIAARGVRRTTSCPSIGSYIDDMSSESDLTCPRLSELGSWGDAGDSDCEEFFSSRSPVDPDQRSDTKKSQSDIMSSKVEEKTCVTSISSGRTPLRCKAALFVPDSSTVSSGCTWAPYSLEQISPPGTSTAPSGPPSFPCDYQRTTVMMRNLPCPFLRVDLITEMDNHGFAEYYSLVYMPLDYTTGLSLGYAFVNFINTEQAQRFMIRFEGFRDWPKPSSKVCSVTWSRTQGLIANIERYRNNPVMSEEIPDGFKPVLFDGNKRIPFPAPTRLLPAVSPVVPAAPPA
ncbi:unnamed protein product [Prorocentrum cordatum]|uniref:Mei2-like C-terminal RNA recognition motif domain-containing protein n=1 Tax=Prorocentrum cordatum TaxID=2364126 RepID=A0ABN9UY20_9DINO|nr:unnamed protein product [Polarella glacialis]|mmetsp:Transcript_100380/g.261658  ORF Transcript_100380/g.261658 Transcript_100380/m.261658 type:complete len:321 (-) Transcript_100380:43-1005(-)